MRSDHAKMRSVWAQLLLLLFNLLITSSTGKTNGVCVSPSGRFPKFSSEGKPPRKVTKGPRDLTLCRVFRKSTCCDVVHTHQALLSIRRLASVGEANQECLELWELLECSICDPRVGVQPGLPLICASFCDKVFHACSNAYFSMDARSQVLSPCGLNDALCGRVSEWVSNGTELCELAGFAVEHYDKNGQEPSCYGGTASLDLIAASWRDSKYASEAENLGMFEDFNRWAKEMPFSERVSWAIGGMVLTAGLLFISKRRSHKQRQKQAAILRTARKMEAKMYQQPSASQRNRKLVGR